MSVTRLHNGAWEVAMMINGYRVHSTYYGYTKREAIASFRRDFLNK